MLGVIATAIIPASGGGTQSISMSDCPAQRTFAAVYIWAPCQTANKDDTKSSFGVVRTFGVTLVGCLTDETSKGSDEWSTHSSP